ncbi:MAG TPA: PAS domain S-box protein [Noviherbaspirillum sp.]
MSPSPVFPQLGPESLALLDAIPAGVCMVDAQGAFLRVNTCFAALLGYASDEMVGMHFARITHHDDRLRDIGGLLRLVAGETDRYHAEKRYVARDGRTAWVSIASSAVRDSSGAFLYALTVVHEIEDRKQAEQALGESELRFRTLFEQSPFSVQLLDMEGRTRRVNKAWQELWQMQTGSPALDYVLGGYSVLSDPQLEEKGIAPLIRRAYTGESVPLPTIHYDPAQTGLSGQARWVSAHAHPIVDEQASVREVMLIHKDVSVETEARAQLQKAKEAAETASQMKSTFLANMSHEIRTPLGAILGFTELLKRDKAAPEERRRYLDIIERNGQSLTQIINDVLDLSQVESGNLKIQPEAVGLRELVQEVVHLFAVDSHKRELSLTATVADGLPQQVRTDPVRVRQILINLVGNALKFTRAGGVHIDVRSHADRVAPTIEIAVQDSGVGIAPEWHDKLFQPFSQIDGSSRRNFGGTGLGLALSRRLARLLGGDVVLARSQPGTGSVFVLSLPLVVDGFVMPDLQGMRTGSGTHEHVLQGLHVLVVDDSQDNRLLLARLLGDEGASVVLTEDARSALALALQEGTGQGAQAGMQRPFDLILMDIQMPGMDGIEATRALRAKGCTTPVLAVSAHAMKEDVQRCAAAGCDGHVAKPVALQELRRQVAALRR